MRMTSNSSPGAILLVMRTTIARRHPRALLIVAPFCIHARTALSKRHPTHEQTYHVHFVSQ